MQDVPAKGVPATFAEYSNGVMELLVTVGVASALVMEPCETSE